MTINCKGELIDLSTPKVMGILNVTPNSFYDGGIYTEEKLILKRVEQLLEEGADFVDIGAYSSKPGAEYISTEEEKSRLTPAVESIIKEFPKVILSLDTFRAEVAKAGIEAGAAMVNDISAGLLDEQMLSTVGQLQVPYIMMHMKGTPQNMQSPELLEYTDLIEDMRYYFSERIAKAREQKINDIIIDPGFGFSKTLAQNYELMQKLDLFKSFDLPVLVGVSRKSMIYKLLNTSPDQALNGTTVLNTYALQKGCSILRVHDVKEAVEVRTILKHIL